MSTRSTPETDTVWSDKSGNILEHARTLERERDEARKERDAAKLFIAERDDALHKLSRCMHALALIASPRRPDGTYNRDRAACELLARETLDATK